MAAVRTQSTTPDGPSEETSRLFAWMDDTFPRANYTQAFVDNDLTEWSLIVEMTDDAETMGEIVLSEQDRVKIVDQILRLSTCSGEAPPSETAKDEKTRRFLNWLEENIDGNAVELLVKNDLTSWDVVSVLDKAALKSIGISKLGSRIKMMKSLQQISQDEIESPQQNRVESQVDVKESDDTDFRMILHELKLDRFAQVLEDQGWEDPKQWGDIEDANLRAFGFKPGHINKFRKYLESVASEREAPHRCLFPRGPNEPKPIIGFVLLGESGAGKSTFKQALYDHCMGIPFEQIEQTERNSKVKAHESQTKDVTLTEVEGDDYVLQVVDTPGIGDTSGRQEDLRHVSNITKFLSEECTFNVVCIIVKNGQNRLSPRFGYIVNEIKSNLTTDVWPHVFTIVTRCAVNRFPGDDTIAVIHEMKLPEPTTDNDRFFFIDNYAYELIAKDRRPPGYERAKRRAYLESKEQLDIILVAASKKERKTGRTIGELRDYRIECKESSRELSAMSQNIIRRQQALEETEAELLQARSAQEMNRKFSEVKSFPQKVRKVMPGGHKCTVCTYSDCSSRCHDPCYVSNPGDVSGCAAFTRGTCDTCGHPQHPHHTHTNFYYEDVMTTETVVDQAAKLRFQQAKSLEEAKLLIQQKFANDIRDLENKRRNISKKIGQLNAKIQALAVVSYNEYFPGYIQELIDDIESKKMSRKKKLRQIASLREELAAYEEEKQLLAMNMAAAGGSEVDQKRSLLGIMQAGFQAGVNAVSKAFS